MDAPDLDAPDPTRDLPPDVVSGVVAGRSALPAFLAVEAWTRARTAGAAETAATRLDEARAEAERIRVDGEASLREAVLAGEREALRDVESRARDRVSEARRAVEAWIRDAEAASEQALGEALALLCGEPPAPSAGETAEA